MFIFSNLAMSLDGKIASSSDSFAPLGSPQDWQEMIQLRSTADAVLMGASTVRVHREPRFAPKSSTQPINILLSSTLEKISPRWPFFQSKEIRRIIFTGSETPKKRIQTFSKCAEVIVLKKPTLKNPIGQQIIEHLQGRHIKRLLVEGGGQVMWHFTSQNLIDEYHVTLTPRLLCGKAAPTLVDGLGLAPKDWVNLKLRQCRIVKNELFLIYSKTQKRGK